LTSGRNVEQTEKDLKGLFDEAHWNRLHLQIIYFGREFCPARGHDLSACQICSFASTKKQMSLEAAQGGFKPSKRPPAKKTKKAKAAKRAKAARPATK